VKSSRRPEKAENRKAETVKESKRRKEGRRSPGSSPEQSASVSASPPADIAEGLAGQKVADEERERYVVHVHVCPRDFFAL
jgi:hypothetical protein